MRIIQLFLGAAACLGASLGASALAQTPPPESRPAETGRFSMTPTQGGFLRLDKQTGAVSFCTVENGLSSCRISADERATFESEVARLRGQIADLKAAQMGAAPGGSAPPEDEEFERALSFTERFMRRMMRVLKEEASGDKP